MRILTTLALVATISGHALAQEANSLNPLYSDLNHPNDERLIEPTSPILGKNLTAILKEDKRHPEIILKDLKEKHPALNRDLQLSAIAYYKTIIPPLKTYCSTPQKEEANDKAIEVVETAAIPIEVLAPLHLSYINNLSYARENYVDLNPIEVEEEALKMATELQTARYECDVVKKLNEMEAKVRRVLPGRLKRLVDLHRKISSPEAAYPRVQFSINGFTQFVYDEILKMPLDRLSQILKIYYDAQAEWIEKKDNDQTQERYFSSFENRALKSGFLPREILLITAYSTRNMPSLDVQYGQDTDKALLLETYFWKFRNHRDYVQKKYVLDIFPNKVLKKNPGLYHFASSALMACEVRLQGYSGAMARLVALGNKVGYKVHKLLGELASKEGRKNLNEIRETAKRQGFRPGIDAGKFGGKHGLKFCRKNTPKKFWPKNQDKILTDPELLFLEEENLSPEREDLL